MRCPKQSRALSALIRPKLDQLMDLVGELVTTESMVVSNPDLKGAASGQFLINRRASCTTHRRIAGCRHVHPYGAAFRRVSEDEPHCARHEQKSWINRSSLSLRGGDTEVDKTINEAIGDPFMHMIRNSMDHGIEPIEERRAKGQAGHWAHHDDRQKHRQRNRHHHRG